MLTKVVSDRASLLVVCPRCGFGNSLRVMVSALHTAREKGLALAHLWRRDSPLRSPNFFEDELIGSRSCDFEYFFEPIPDFAPYSGGGESIRLLYEEGNEFVHEGLNVCDQVSYRCVAFQNHGPLTDEHLARIDTLIVFTSLNLPIQPSDKITLYQKHFRPRPEFLEELDRRKEQLDGRWLCVHLRSQVRSAFGLAEWDLADLVRKAKDLLSAVPYERILVFSDSEEARERFENSGWGDVPVQHLDWGVRRPAESMFLDFLAISKASLILNSGLTSFSYEASLFGGGVPIFDLCRGLLLPR